MGYLSRLLLALKRTGIPLLDFRAFVMRGWMSGDHFLIRRISG